MCFLALCESRKSYGGYVCGSCGFCGSHKPRFPPPCIFCGLCVFYGSHEPPKNTWWRQMWFLCATTIHIGGGDPPPLCFLVVHMNANKHQKRREMLCNPYDTFPPTQHVSRLGLSCLVLSCLVLSCRVLSCLVLSCLV